MADSNSERFAFIQFFVPNTPADNVSNIIQTDWYVLSTYFPHGSLTRIAKKCIELHYKKHPITFDENGAAVDLYKHGVPRLTYLLKGVRYPRNLKFMLTGRMLLVKSIGSCHERILAWKRSKTDTLRDGKICKLLEEIDQLSEAIDSPLPCEIRKCFTDQEWKDFVEDLNDRLSDMHIWLGESEYMPRDAIHAVQNCLDCYPWTVVFDNNPDSDLNLAQLVRMKNVY